jgi:hypothetical protein
MQSCGGGAPLNLNDVKVILRGATTEPTEEWGAIIREVSSSAVVIVAVSKSSSDVRLDQAGTGTLVSIEGAHYILTAAHVWDRVLRHADKLGITIRTGRGLPNEFLMDITSIATCSLPDAWGEWGPDLILLRIPPFHVGTVTAFRPFYSLSAERAVVGTTDYLEVWMLCGAPEALGEFTQTPARVHAHFQGRTFQVVESSSHNLDGFDYVDVQAHWPAPEIAPRFGGVSGGGLWKVLIFFQPSTGKLDWLATLEGVAFYHLRTEGDHGFIRCHGPESIRRLVAHCTTSRE